IHVSASGEEVRVERQPVDEVLAYLENLLEVAIDVLTKELMNKTVEYGRITKLIALGIKAKVLVFAASPLFNGNTDYAGFANNDGTLLFNSNYDANKWQKAVTALKEAIDLAHSLGHKLYELDRKST